MNPKPIDYSLNMFRIGQAIRVLKEARDLLKAADAPMATAYVRGALKSAEGAARHAYGKVLRQERRRALLAPQMSSPARTGQPRARGPK